MKPEVAAGRGPGLRLETYFAGRAKAWGIFEDRFGTLRRQFEIDVEGSWDGKTLTLVEDFTYDDGRTERRTWLIDTVGAHGYRGRADGVIGFAEGSASGNLLSWRYRFALEVGARTWSVRFDDRLFLQGDDILINRAAVTKLGVLIGQVTCVFRKLPAAGAGGRTIATAAR